MIDKYYRIKYRLYIIFLSLRWIRKTCLGDIVIYRDKEYFISNGVNPGYWTLQQPNFGERIEYALRSECKKKLTFNNYFKNFQQGYRFYRDNWYGIWVSSREISPWIRALNIWKK